MIVCLFCVRPIIQHQQMTIYLREVTVEQDRNSFVETNAWSYWILSCFYLAALIYVFVSTLSACIKRFTTTKANRNNYLTKLVVLKVFVTCAIVARLAIFHILIYESTATDFPRFRLLLTPLPIVFTAISYMMMGYIFYCIISDLMHYRSEYYPRVRNAKRLLITTGIFFMVLYGILLVIGHQAKYSNDKNQFLFILNRTLTLIITVVSLGVLHYVDVSMTKVIEGICNYTGKLFQNEKQKQLARVVFWTLFFWAVIAAVQFFFGCFNPPSGDDDLSKNMEFIIYSLDKNFHLPVNGKELSMALIFYQVLFYLLLECFPCVFITYRMQPQQSKQTRPRNDSNPGILNASSRTYTDSGEDALSSNRTTDETPLLLECSGEINNTSLNRSNFK